MAEITAQFAGDYRLWRLHRPRGRPQVPGEDPPRTHTHHGLTSAWEVSHEARLRRRYGDRQAPGEVYHKLIKGFDRANYPRRNSSTT